MGLLWSISRNWGALEEGGYCSQFILRKMEMCGAGDQNINLGTLT